jgi:hypothetical protein
MAKLRNGAAEVVEGNWLGAGHGRGVYVAQSVSP